MKYYIKYIKKVKPSGPYILGGWSFGAVVAYEMAVLLEKAGEKVENLYLLDPIIEHPEKEKELTRKLMETSFFQAYLNNDPLFGRFKKLAFPDFRQVAKGHLFRCFLPEKMPFRSRRSVPLHSPDAPDFQKFAF